MRKHSGYLSTTFWISLCFYRIILLRKHSVFTKPFCSYGNIQMSQHFDLVIFLYSYKNILNSEFSIFMTFRDAPCVFHWITLYFIGCKTIMSFCISKCLRLVLRIWWNTLMVTKFKYLLETYNNMSIFKCIQRKLCSVFAKTDKNFCYIITYHLS